MVSHNDFGVKGKHRQELCITSDPSIPAMYCDDKTIGKRLAWRGLMAKGEYHGRISVTVQGKGERRNTIHSHHDKLWDQGSIPSSKISFGYGVRGGFPKRVSGGKVGDIWCSW